MIEVKAIEKGKQGIMRTSYQEEKQSNSKLSAGIRNRNDTLVDDQGKYLLKLATTNI